jgi:hypothetical protein
LEAERSNDQIIAETIENELEKIELKASDELSKIEIPETRTFSESAGPAAESGKAENTKRRVMSRLIWKHVEDEQKKEREQNSNLSASKQGGHNPLVRIICC